MRKGSKKASAKVFKEVSTCRELGVSFDETAEKVKEKFSLGEEEARKNMQLYW